MTADHAQWAVAALGGFCWGMFFANRKRVAEASNFVWFLAGFAILLLVPAV